MQNITKKSKACRKANRLVAQGKGKHWGLTRSEAFYKAWESAKKYTPYPEEENVDVNNLDFAML